MRSCCVTDVGQKRTTNQDFVFASDTPVGPLPNLLIVADGMGGHQAGDMASRYAAEVIVSHIKRSRERNPIRVLRSAIETANERVLEKAADMPLDELYRKRRTERYGYDRRSRNRG